MNLELPKLIKLDKQYFGQLLISPLHDKICMLRAYICTGCTEIVQCAHGSNKVVHGGKVVRTKTLPSGVISRNIFGARIWKICVLHP